MKLYHGSPEEIKEFKVKKGSGLYGEGLYLTPSLKWAEFYAQGGRSGTAGQSLSPNSGNIYEFNVDTSNFFEVTEYTDFLNDVLDLDSASETFEQWGDLERVSKHASEWAEENGYSGLDFTKVDKVPQILIIDLSAIESYKAIPLSVTSTLSVSEIQSFAKEFIEIFGEESFPIPLINFKNLRNKFGYASMNPSLKKGRFTVNPSIDLEKGLVDSTEDLRKVLAHEMIHVWEYYHSESLKPIFESQNPSKHEINRIINLFKQESHGKEFTYWMNVFNAKYGKDFVTLSYDFKSNERHIKPYFLLIVPTDTNTYGYKFAVARALTKKARHYIEQYVSKLDGRVFKTQSDFFKNIPRTVGDKAFYNPTNKAEGDFIKNLYESNNTVTLSSLHNEDDYKDFLADFILNFRQKYITLSKILHNFDRKESIEILLKPYISEVYRQMMMHYGSVGTLPKDLDFIQTPLFAQGSIYKPKSIQFNQALLKWVEFLNDMSRSLQSKYRWLDSNKLEEASRKIFDLVF